MDNEYRHFVRATLQESVIDRLTAEQCLRLDFFTKHKIPQKLSLEMTAVETPPEKIIIPTFSGLKGMLQSSPISELSIKYRFFAESTFFDDFIKSKTSLEFGDRIDAAIVDYPDIRIKAELALLNFQKCERYAQVLERVFERFDDICRHHIVSRGFIHS